MTFSLSEAGTQGVVLHFTADYPDLKGPPTTQAIRNLIKTLDKFQHVVISLHRTSNPFSVCVHDLGSDEGIRVFSYWYFGFPFGIGLHRSMHRVARTTERLTRTQGIRTSCAFAHKLSFEGIAAYYFARKNQIPLFTSIRGEVESKVLRTKFTYRSMYRSILAYASKIFFVSEWYRPEIYSLYPAAHEKSLCLPNVIQNVQPTIRPVVPTRGLVAALDLGVRRKNLHGILNAFSVIARTHPDITLDIIGPGTPKSVSATQKKIAKLGLNTRVNLLGPLSHSEFLSILPTYAGLVLPSWNETFGMVYVEALFSGVPIVYSRGTGIDGYLEGIDVGCAVSPHCARSITDAIEKLISSNTQLRANIVREAPTLYERFSSTKTSAIVGHAIISATTKPL
jgi:glycosyltransferase involved in cell wall biosynthesis